VNVWPFRPSPDPVAAAGLRRVVAATDAANAPSANAFLRAGYSEVGRVFRYYWRKS